MYELKGLSTYYLQSTIIVTKFKKKKRIIYLISLGHFLHVVCLALYSVPKESQWVCPKSLHLLDTLKFLTV